MKVQSLWLVSAGLALTLVMPGCGGGGGGGGIVTPTSLPTPPPTPAAAVGAVGNGALVVHPSAISRFRFALEVPLAITETAGGTADWNFARMSLKRRGAEIERSEIGADVIRAAGYGRVNPRSAQTVSAVFHFNNSNFDEVDLTLGFGDVKDARLFTVDVPFSSFTDVTVSVTPLSVEHDTVVRH